MNLARFSLRFAAFTTSTLCAVAAQAAIPDGYAGTPYMGTAQTIPGRVELANMDLGGLGVGWDTDWNRTNSAQYQPISGNDYRSDDQNLPNICKTNRLVEMPGEGSEDFWEEAAGGGRYPSEAMPYVYYMGYSHVGDWVRVTVDVQQAGTYDVSSSWACDSGPQCGLSIWFNDGSDPAAEMDGVNKTGTVLLDSTANYHIWRDYPSFVQVELSKGLQIMTFRVEEAPHLQYGFLQFDLVGGNPGAGGAGGAGNGGASGDGAGGAAVAGAGGVGGEAPAAGSAGTPANAGSNGGVAGAGGTPAAAGSAAIAGSAGAAGSTTASAGGNTSVSPPAAMTADTNVDSSSGCSHTGTGGSTAPWSMLALLGAATLLRRRSQR